MLAKLQGVSYFKTRLMYLSYATSFFELTPVKHLFYSSCNKNHGTALNFHKHF